MINKNKFNIRNTKKVLHKVGKQWVVLSHATVQDHQNNGEVLITRYL
ncbi:MAG: Hypothetical protein AJITA_00811 [Acetilactobacillus jinshanensis]